MSINNGPRSVLRTGLRGATASRCPSLRRLIGCSAGCGRVPLRKSAHSAEAPQLNLRQSLQDRRQAPRATQCVDGRELGRRGEAALLVVGLIPTAVRIKRGICLPRHRRYSRRSFSPEATARTRAAAAKRRHRNRSSTTPRLLQVPTPQLRACSVLVHEASALRNRPKMQLRCGAWPTKFAIPISGAALTTWLARCWSNWKDTRRLRHSPKSEIGVVRTALA
jgi:hypothetical protein